MRRLLLAAVVVALCALAPLASPFTLTLTTEALIFGLFAMSLDLMVGYTRLYSFGHAAAYGLGAYATALMLLHFGLPLPLGILAGVALSAVIAVPIAWVCTKSTGVSFAMLTLAFAQLLYFIAFHLADWTGGDDGLRGIPQLALGLPGFSVRVDSTLSFYYFCYALVGVAVAGLKRILDSPFGAVLQAIRENSDRATACGYDVNRVKLLSFVFSALFTGLAGGLDALRLTVVPIESLYWTTSGQVVMMTLLGGAGTFFGPFVGAGAFLVLEDRLSVFTESWPLVVGAIFSLFVLFLPRGIWGTVTGGWRRAPAAPSAASVPSTTG
jgi:branched-chain amino acid transport system permease protein